MIHVPCKMNAIMNRFYKPTVMLTSCLPWLMPAKSFCVTRVVNDVNSSQTVCVDRCFPAILNISILQQNMI